ncbi:uncharacterized protein LOC121874220 isoform X2 [Homarus americanus]|uniref:uncharacterized protein LOC121874220 isoform X2 n=1 Tax=Homarus americanus TaxID=6706 RepID=UPI001C4767C3|nr:uncharacterized protein LOC121874220 isoform X2 [Homarus americanus]
MASTSCIQFCSGCGKEIRSRRQALYCDYCHQWRHWKCVTTITQDKYRKISKHLKEGGSFAWHCPECPATVDLPLEESSTSADNSFTFNFPIEPVTPVQETSLKDEPIPENLPDDQPVIWEVIPFGTNRGKLRLLSSDGYSYTVRKEKESVTYWTCSIRQKHNRCPASVIQRETTFKPGLQAHNHPGTPGLLATTKVSVAVKERCALDNFTSAAQIVKEELISYKQSHPNTHRLPKPSSIVKQGNRHRQAQRSHHLTQHNFELMSDSLSPDFIRRDIQVCSDDNQTTERHNGMAIDRCARQRSFRETCGSFVQFRASKDGQRLSVIKMDSTHNHPVSKETFKCLPKQRRLDDNEMKEVQQMLQTQPNKKILQDLIKNKTGKQVTLRDISNQTAKLNRSFSNLQEPDSHVTAESGMNSGTAMSGSSSRRQEKRKVVYNGDGGTPKVVKVGEPAPPAMDYLELVWQPQGTDTLPKNGGRWLLKKEVPYPVDQATELDQDVLQDTPQNQDVQDTPQNQDVLQDTPQNQDVLQDTPQNQDVLQDTPQNQDVQDTPQNQDVLQHNTDTNQGKQDVLRDTEDTFQVNPANCQENEGLGGCEAQRTSERPKIEADNHGGVNPDSDQHCASSNPSTKTKVYHCPICHTVVASRQSLFKHRKRKHEEVMEDCEQRKTLQCMECSLRFVVMKDLLGHYQAEHQRDIFLRAGHFKNKEEFMSWMKDVEKKTRARFVKHSGQTQIKHAKVDYFYCNRSGSFVSKGKGRRSIKAQGSSKINGICSAFIKVVHDRLLETCTTEFCLDHSHECDITHLKLSDDLQTSIATKLAKGVEIDEILDDVRSNKGYLDRDSLLVRKDIHNIKRRFNVDVKEQHNDDVNSARLSPVKCCEKSYLGTTWCPDHFVNML